MFEYGGNYRSQKCNLWVKSRAGTSLLLLFPQDNCYHRIKIQTLVGFELTIPGININTQTI